MTCESSSYLIVGLGNPGKAYAATRHNVGFRVLEKIAAKYGFSFRRVSSVHGLLAQGMVEGKKLLLLMPETYMNSSGESVRACMSYYGIPLLQACIVCDEIYLPFGRLRMRAYGGSGGHNGLKSIESHLGTQNYARLRVGIGDREEGDLADHVLSSFLQEEEERMPDLLERASSVLQCWIEKGIVQAVQCANADQEKK